MPKSRGRRKPKRVHTPPPPPKEDRTSPRWYVVLMFSLMAVGVLVIVLNYIGLLGGQMRSLLLYTGLGAIGAGFIMTLNYR